MDDHNELDSVEKAVNTKRIKRLAWAELFDAWRVFPRVLVIAYMALVAYLVKQYFDLKTYAAIQCNPEIVEAMLAKKLPIDQIQQLACHATAVYGGPSTEHTIFITTICGLSAAIFGLYTSSGRNWIQGAIPWQFRKINKEEPEEKNED